MSKICKKCGSEKPLSEYYHGGQDNICKHCYKAQTVAWVKSHPERYKIIKDRYRKSAKGRAASRKDGALFRARHPEKVSAAKKASYLKRPDYYKAKRAAYAKATGYKHSIAKVYRDIEMLGTNYLKEKLVRGTHLKRSQIPADLVELYRAHLKLKRLCRNQKTSQT